MESVKNRLGRVAILMMAMIVLLMIGSGCMGNRLVKLKPVYAKKLTKTATKYKIQVLLPEDARKIKQAGDFIGHVKNGYGVRLADVTASQHVNIWVQNCISKNFKKAGFNVTTTGKPADAICVATSIRTLKCEAMMRYDAVIELDLKLEKNDLTFFKRAFIGRASQVNWAATSAGYQETLISAMKQCLDKMMPVLIKEIENSQKTIKNTAIVSPKIKKVHKSTTKQKIKTKKDSKKSLDDIYF
jgi:hypothetical protein